MPLPCYHSVISRSDLHISFSRRRSQVFNPSPYIIIIEIFPSIYAFYTHTFLREHKIAVKAPLNCTENYQLQDVNRSRATSWLSALHWSQEWNWKKRYHSALARSLVIHAARHSDRHESEINFGKKSGIASGDGRWRRRHQALVSEHSLARKIWQMFCRAQERLIYNIECSRVMMIKKCGAIICCCE